MNKKQINRLNELDLKANAWPCKSFTSEEIHERCELEFIRNKQNINFRLPTANKYYYAAQCYKFEKNIKKHGFYNTPIDEIYTKGISFNKHSINIGGPYSRDIKRFNDKIELLGFVVGFNEACVIFSYNNRINQKAS
tara:strand:+ start:72 stop:482 length:411 start_codon:yes stop_codon:yes gene_type:complete